MSSPAITPGAGAAPGAPGASPAPSPQGGGSPQSNPMAIIGALTQMTKLLETNFPAASQGVATIRQGIQQIAQAMLQTQKPQGGAPTPF